jgi:hypothetical protein
MRPHSDRPEPSLLVEPSAQKKLAHQSVIFDRQTLFSLSKCGEIFSKDPVATFVLKPYGDFSYVVQGGKGGRSLR